MTRRILAGIAGLIVCAAAYAAGTSIWNASPRGTVSGTDRIPVATSGSSGPLYVTPATVKAYTFTPPISAQVADSTSAGGNARGANAVDWQTARTHAEMVASGILSVVGGGEDNSAIGVYSAVSGGSVNSASGESSAISGGSGNTASGDYSAISGGSGNTASGDYSAISGGRGNTASGDYSWIPGGVNGDTLGVAYSYAYRGNFGQTFGVNIGVATVDDTPTRLSAVSGSYGAAFNTVIPSGYSATCVGIFTATDGVGAAGFECKGVAVNLAGTTTLVTGACASVGTPSASLSTATMSMQANNTDDTLEYVFTGVSEAAVNVGGESKCSTMYVPAEG